MSDTGHLNRFDGGSGSNRRIRSRRWEARRLNRPRACRSDLAGLAVPGADRVGAVLRVDGDRTVTTVADGLGAPQGLVVRGAELFTVDTEHRTLRAVSLITGESRVDAEDLAVGPPPGVTSRAEVALFAHGMPGSPGLFAGLAAAPDGSLLLSANGEGSLVSLSPTGPPAPAAPTILTTVLPTK